MNRAMQKSVNNNGTSLQAGNEIKPLQSADTPVSRNVLNTYLKAGTDYRKALEQVYTPEEMSAWDRLRKQADVDNRLDRRAINNSQTSRLNDLQQAGEVALQQGRALRAVPYGHILPEIAGLAKALGKGAELLFSQNPQKYVDEIMVKALLDPQLAEQLLTNPTRISRPYFQSTVRPYLKQILLGSNMGNPQAAASEQGKAGKMLNAAGMNQ